jgi:hypothetical protein
MPLFNVTINNFSEINEQILQQESTSQESPSNKVDLSSLVKD